MVLSNGSKAGIAAGTKSISEIAREVRQGKWGQGEERKRLLEQAGYPYAAVQAELNRTDARAAQHIDQRGIDLIKRFESCKLTAYRLDGDKYYTIGWGHLDPNLKAGDTITQAQADAMLKADLVTYENYVKKYITCCVLTAPRLGALVSYCYNRGVGKFRDELAAQSHNAKEIADNIVRLWGSNERYKDALIKRRKAERELFLSD
jgi:GH24 family phage-related lysozyme (muramidase)